ncbi:PP2C family protein-serine/threonine phosphatase [Dactylosporangium sp. McL0621]|uniref:PP2C family protein-serine/threonine phosphatase n=1 Tax=Dactylosporangium sp. McL0621 TaxID=3415678 RepID=UPI003CF76FBA
MADDAEAIAAVVREILAVVPAGCTWLRPVRTATGEVSDFIVAATSGEGADLYGLGPSRVGRRLTELYPTVAGGPLWALYQQVLRTGAPAGLDDYHYLQDAAGFAADSSFGVNVHRVLDGLLVWWERVDEARRRLDRTESLGSLGWAEYDLLTGRSDWSPGMYRIFERDPALGPMPRAEQSAAVVPEDTPIAELSWQTLDSDTRMRSDSDTRMRSDSDTRIRSDSDTRMRSDGDTRMRSDSDTRIRSDSDTRMRSDSDTRMRSDSDTRMRSDSDTRMRSDSDTRMRSDSDTRMRSDSDTRMRSDSDTRMRSDSDTRMRSGGGATSDVTLRFRVGEGTKHLRVLSDLARDAAGAPLKVYAVVQDVTARELSRSAIERLSDQLHTRELTAIAEHRLAAQLQHLIQPVPREPFPLSGLRATVGYLPAESALRVGGDWYHAQTLPDGPVVLAVGDVAGHGLEAANGMAHLRFALVAWLSIGIHDPGTLLGHMNRLCVQLGLTGTAVIGTFDPTARRLTWARAGHLPPLLARAGAADELPLPPGLLLGAVADAAYPAETTALSPGDVVLLYTDGLVERRAMDVGTQLDWVKAALSAATGPDITDPLPGLRKLLRRPSPDDDTCTLAVQVL